jgi:hypothetical protein
MQPKCLRFPSFLFLLPFSVFIQNARAQCTSSAARNATTAASVSFTGSRFGFSVPGNALQSDNVYATATALLSVLWGPTQNLTLTNFGFSIPPAATICGVVAVVKKKAANINVLSTVMDNSVKLVKGGVVGGTNKALAGNWTATNTSFTYGGETDTWGLALTPDDINASNFGIAFSGYISGTISLIPSVQIDNIQVTVYYTMSLLPVVLSDFKALVNEDKVQLQWKSENEINFSRYEIEKSSEGTSFSKVATINASPISKQYTYTDAYPNTINFYRLKMIDEDGSFKYSPVVAVKLEAVSKLIQVNPNPVKDLSVLHLVGCREGYYMLEISNGSGQVICSKHAYATKDISIPLSLTGYAKGLYIIKVYSEKDGFVQAVKLLKE